MATKSKRRAFRPVAARIVDTFDAAAILGTVESGASWYADALDLAQGMAKRHGIAVETAAGVIAATSPLRGWAQNVETAERILAHGAPVGIFHKDHPKVARILAGTDPLDVLGGPKVRAFYGNIVSAGLDDGVTIDRHAIDIAHGHKHTDAQRPALTDARYALGEHVYRVATRRINAEHGLALTPAMVQSVTWASWRESHGIVA